MTSSGGDLIDKGDDRWKGPGHNAIFVERDTVFLVNHAYDAQANGRSILWIRPLYWTSQGWPTLDKSQGTAVGTLRPSRAFRPLADHALFPVQVDARGRSLPKAWSGSVQPVYRLPVWR